jgi:hypothetical protein
MELRACRTANRKYSGRGGLSLRKIFGDLNFGGCQPVRGLQYRRPPRLRASWTAGHDQHSWRKGESVSLGRQWKYIEHERCRVVISNLKTQMITAVSVMEISYRLGRE